jgi:KaiC/GvpD/RAD55 family RecA-like ATPase
VTDAQRRPLGIDPLDRQLEGGLPRGSVVAYCAPPASGSELLLYELTATGETLYLTTDRSEDAVANALTKATCPTGDPTIRSVSGGSPLKSASRAVRGAGDGVTIVVDAADRLERMDRDRYRRFLDELGTHVRAAGTVAVLHCLRADDDPPLRTMTKHVADVIFRLHRDRRGTEIDTRLGIPKLRGGRGLDATIKLELEERVRVDTSRDIA